MGLIVIMIIFAALTYFLNRLSAVSAFRMAVLDMIRGYCIRTMTYKNEMIDLEEIFDRFLVDQSFLMMVFSLKSVKLESFYSYQEIEELLYGPKIETAEKMESGDNQT